MEFMASQTRERSVPLAPARRISDEPARTMLLMPCLKAPVSLRDRREREILKLWFVKGASLVPNLTQRAIRGKCD